MIIIITTNTHPKNTIKTSINTPANSIKTFSMVMDNYNTKTMITQAKTLKNPFQSHIIKIKFLIQINPHIKNTFNIRGHSRRTNLMDMVYLNRIYINIQEITNKVINTDKDKYNLITKYTKEYGMKEN
jgi:hypothetical protein